MTHSGSQIRVLHVIPALTRGGPGRGLLGMVQGAALASHVSHAVASLLPPDPWMLRQANARGVKVVPGSSLSSLKAAIGEADIMQLYFWNTPILYEALASELPATRLLIWVKVSGEHPPQMIPEQLLDYADVMLASCAHTTTLPGLSHLDYIPTVGGWERVDRIKRDADRPFTVGYIGTLDFAKLHPRFVELCAQVPRARFIVCGDGSAAPTVRSQATRAGIGERFELWGYVEDIGAALGQMDVFGYPLDDRTYAASEVVLEEAMYAGVTPVVMGPAALRRVVSDGKNGLVARTERQYTRAVKYLHDRPEERARLGAAAREHAIRSWAPELVAARWSAVYEKLMQRPKRRREPYRLAQSGAGRFIEALAGKAPEFSISLTEAQEDIAARADRAISNVAGALATGDGGVFPYRDRYPGDPHLRLWSGLILHNTGHRAVAAGEFAAALRLGLDRPRVRSYLSRATQRTDAPQPTRREATSQTE